MKKYTITTRSTAFTNYIVEANSKKEAREQYELAAVIRKDRITIEGIEACNDKLKEIDDTYAKLVFTAVEYEKKGDFKQAVDFFKDFKLKQIATTTYTISESGEVYANTTSLEFVLSVVDFAWEDLQHSYDIVDLVELPSIDVAVMQGLLAYLPAKCLDFYKFNSLGVHTMYGNSLYGLDDDLLRMVIIDLPDLGITPNLDMLYLGDLSNLLYKAKLAYLNLFNKV
jgi:hypothetical protein